MKTAIDDRCFSCLEVPGRVRFNEPVTLFFNDSKWTHGGLRIKAPSATGKIYAVVNIDGNCYRIRCVRDIPD